MVAENKVETRIRSGRASAVGTNPKSFWVDNKGITTLPTRSRSATLDTDAAAVGAVPAVDADTDTDAVAGSSSWEECRTS